MEFSNRHTGNEYSKRDRKNWPEIEVDEKQQTVTETQLLFFYSIHAYFVFAPILIAHELLQGDGRDRREENSAYSEGGGVQEARRGLKLRRRCCSNGKDNSCIVTDGNCGKYLLSSYFRI